MSEWVFITFILSFIVICVTGEKSEDGAGDRGDKSKPSDDPLSRTGRAFGGMYATSALKHSTFTCIQTVFYILLFLSNRDELSHNILFLDFQTYSVNDGT